MLGKAGFGSLKGDIKIGLVLIVDTTGQGHLLIME